MDYTGSDVVLHKRDEDILIVMTKDNVKATLKLDSQEAAQLMSYLMSCFGMTLEEVVETDEDDDEEQKVLN